MNSRSWIAAGLMWGLCSLGAVSTLLGAAEPDRLPLRQASAVVRLFDPAEAPIKGAVRSLVQALDGQLVVGSNQLSAFDGHEWQSIEVPGAYAFRGLAASGRRIYVGAVGAIGFLETEPGGASKYTSLLPELEKLGLGELGDIWSVHPVEGGAVWVTSQRVLRWDGTSFSTWTLPSKSRLAGFTIPGGVLVEEEGVGVLVIGAMGEPKQILAEKDLPQNPITWILPLGPGSSDSLVGLKDGAYRWDGKQGFQRLDTLSSALAGSVPMGATFIGEDRFAIGTLNKGIVIANREGTPVRTISPENGLPDDIVYAIASTRSPAEPDGKGQPDDVLFAGLPSGLARIDGPGEAYFFGRRSGLDGGEPRKVVTHGGNPFVLTSGGLFEVEAEANGPRLGPILKETGPLWDETNAAGQLWIGGFGGLWRSDGGQAARELFDSTDVFMVAPSARSSDEVLFTEGYDLKSLIPSSHGGWASHDLRIRLPDTPVSMAEDSSGTVWISMMKDGIWGLRWNGPDTSPPMRVETRFSPGRGLPDPITRPNLVRLGSGLFLFSEQGIFGFRSDGLAFEPVASLAKFIGIAALSDDGRNQSLWVVRSRSLPGSLAVVSVSRGQDGSVSWKPVQVAGLDSVGSVSSFNRTESNGSETYWLSGTRGLLSVESSGLGTAASLPSPPLTLVTTSQEGETQSVDIKGSAKLAPGVGKIEFRFPIPSPGGEPVFYQTRLQGVDSGWTPPSTEPIRQVGGLAPGHYSFHVRALDRFDRLGPESVTAFTLLAPLYLRPAAFAVDALLLIAVIAGLVRWRLQHLKRQNRKLTDLVAERTREIELASTAKSDFLENISHEIRNPLNGLTGLLELLHEDKLGTRERDLARSLKTVAGTLTRVFEDVLEFSKLEYGYAQLHRRPFKLRKALGEVIDLFRAPAGQVDSALRLLWPEALSDGFEGDEDKIRTVVGNFVSNALKYAPGTPIEIRVDLAAESGGMADVYIDVTDHGPGIPVNEQELIFRKFVRGSRAKRDNLPGTGLGLATCSALAKLMNGSVGVESRPGKGATFSLRLSLGRPEKTASSGPFPTSVNGAESGGESALIVEDEPYNQVVLEGIALELGYTPDKAGDADEALIKLRQKAYDIVFLDWELPGAKGGEVAQEIRGADGGKHPIILATTAHDSDEMQERCRRAGMDGFLLKPYDAAKIRRAVDSVRLWRTAAGQNCERAEAGPFWSDRPAEGPNGGLDLKAFEQYARAQDKDPKEARGLFLDALEAQVQHLVQAADRENAAAIAEIAHRLRALSGSIRAHAVNEAAARLETLARSGMDECRGQVDLVTEACKTLAEELGESSGQSYDL